MPRMIGLLRGINVGGNKKVPMAELRAVVEKVGHTRVATLLQSGNVVFDARRAAEEKLRAQLEEAIEKKFGFQVSVVLRTRDELAEVIAKAPMRDHAEAAPSQFLVFFLSAAPDAKALAAIDAKLYAPDEFIARGREIYAWFPHTIRDSKLATVLGGKKLGVVPTARNWATVTKLLALADAP